MERRDYLLTAGATLSAVVAGCSSDDADTTAGNGDTPTTQPETTTETPTTTTKTPTPTDTESTEPATETETDTETETTTESPDPATFEISAEVPESAAVNEDITYTLTIENTGEQTGTAEFGLDLSTAGDDVWDEVFTSSTELDGGESQASESDPFAFEYVRVVQWRFWLEGPENTDTWTGETEVLHATQSFGETYVSPADVALAVDDIELKTAFTYEDFQGEDAEQSASDGMQWAFVYLTAENQSSEPTRLPTSYDIALLANNRQYDSTYIRKEGGKYEGGEVQPGVVRDGWLAFEIPEELTRSDLRVVYSGEDFTGSWRAEWRAA